MILGMRCTKERDFCMAASEMARRRRWWRRRRRSEGKFFHYFGWLCDLGGPDSSSNFRHTDGLKTYLSWAHACMYNIAAYLKNEQNLDWVVRYCLISMRLPRRHGGGGGALCFKVFIHKSRGELSLLFSTTKKVNMWVCNLFWSKQYIFILKHFTVVSLLC